MSHVFLLSFIFAMGGAYHGDSYSNGAGLRPSASASSKWDRLPYWPIALEGSGTAPIGAMPMFGVSADRFMLAAEPPTAQTPHVEVIEPLSGAPSESSWLQRCFMIHSVLSPEECEAMIAVCEDVGFLDVDRGKNSQGALTWLLSEQLVERLFNRCAAFLPKTLELSATEHRTLAGLNARGRFYRYQPNAYDTFRPHRDDSSPGSGFVPGSGAREMRWDAGPVGKRRASLFSFLLYLNDDFGGGETTFFPPDDMQGIVDGPRGDCRESNLGGEDTGGEVAVRPRQGSVLCFPQTLKLSSDCRADDDSERALFPAPLHEGSPVRELRADGGFSRPKYVMRSDVLYDDLWGGARD